MGKHSDGSRGFGFKLLLVLGFLLGAFLLVRFGWLGMQLLDELNGP